MNKFQSKFNGKSSGGTTSPVGKSTTSSTGGEKKATRTMLDIRVIQTKNGEAAKVQLGKDVELFYQGKKVDLGEYNSAFLKSRDELEESINFAVEKEWITVEQAEEKVTRLNEKNITAALEVKV
jgi:hypothetical protein